MFTEAELIEKAAAKEDAIKVAMNWPHRTYLIQKIAEGALVELVNLKHPEDGRRLVMPKVDMTKVEEAAEAFLSAVLVDDISTLKWVSGA